MLREIYMLITVVSLGVILILFGMYLGYGMGATFERERIKQVLFQGQSVKTLTYEQFCKEINK